MTDEGVPSGADHRQPVFSPGSRGRGGGKPLNPKTGGWGVAAAGVLFCLEAKRLLNLKKKFFLLRFSSQSSVINDDRNSYFEKFVKKRKKKGLEQ